MSIFKTVLFLMLTLPTFSQGIDQYSETDKFMIFKVDPVVGKIQMFWKGPDGKVLGNFDALLSMTKDKPLLFACNGGMFMEDRRPVGLYVENGKTLKDLNTRTGSSANFYIQPNGVFYVRKDGYVGICKTQDYNGSGVQYATQSGPMLVIESIINPKFDKNSTSLKIRNGVGVTKYDKVIFILSKYPVSFYEFAQAFSDQGCENALFLDGDIKNFYYPDGMTFETHRYVGVMIGVVK